MPLAELLEEDVQIEMSTEDLFTGREDAIEKFHKLYDSMKLPEKKGYYEVMLYYGIGGIGKSKLIKKICGEITEKTGNKKIPNFAYFTFEGNSSKEELKELFMFSLSRQMMMYNKELKFFLFDTALAKILADRGKSLERYEEKAKASIMLNSFFDATLSIVEHVVPGLETVTKVVNAFCQFAENRIYAKERKKLENSYTYNEIMNSNITIEELEKKLPEYFRRDIQAIFLESGQPYIVFLDCYEDYNGSDDGWLCKELVNIPNVLWVIASREPLGWNEKILPKEHHYEIKELQEDEVIEYFRKAKIEDEELVKSLCGLTNGTPEYMNLCRRLYYELKKNKIPTIDDFGVNASGLVERYLKNMDGNEKDIVIMLSFFPRVWDLDMAVQVAAKLGYNPNSIPKLIRSIIFDKVMGKYKMHETLRKVISMQYRNEIAERACIEIFEYLVGSLTRPEGPGEDYLDVFKQFSEVFVQCGMKVVSDENMQIVLNNIQAIPLCGAELQEEHEILSEIEDAMKKYEYLPETIYECMEARFGIYRRFGNLENSIVLLEEMDSYVIFAMKEKTVYEEKVNELRGLVYLDMKCYEEALKCLDEVFDNKALRLGFEFVDPVLDMGKKNEYIDLFRIGFYRATVYSKMKNYEKAKDMFNIVYSFQLFLFGEDHINPYLTLHNLANTYLGLNEYEIARDKFEEVKAAKERVLGSEIHPMLKDTLMALKYIYYDIFGDFKNAKRIYTQLYEIYKQELDENHPDMVRMKAEIEELEKKIADAKG